MIKLIVAVLGMIVAASGGALAKGDITAGKNKVSICISCHGLKGISPSDRWPNLAGQKEAYLVAQLKAFKAGKRKEPQMEAMSKRLSDQDIENLAAYYSSQTSAAAAPPAPAEAAAAAAAELPHVPITVSAPVVARVHPTRQYWADKMPDGEGRAVIWEKCVLCHDLQRTIAFARPKEQWEQVVDSMIRRGSPVTPEEKPIIVSYLTKYFGPTSPPVSEAGMKACKQSEWPKGSADFRNWKGATTIWISNQQGASIDIVDAATNKIARRINCVSAPDRIEFSRDGNTAYAPDRVEHNVTVIDTRTGAIKAKIPLVDRPNTAVLTRDYKKLYLGIWPVTGDEDKKGYIQVLDTEKLQITKTIEVKGGIHDTWMSPDGKTMLAMSPEGRFMDLFDTTNENKIWTCCNEGEIGTMNMEAGPDGATSRIFFSYSGFAGVVVIDAKTGKELKRVPHPVDTEGPYKGIPHESGNGKALGFHGGEISPDGKTYWVMQGSFVYRYGLPDFKPMGDVHLALVDQAGKRFSPAVEGSWLTISPDGNKVYAVRPGRNLLSVIDVKTMKEEALIATGEYPLHVSVWPRGTP